MEPDIRQTVPFQKPPKSTGYYVGAERRSIRPLPDEIVAHIARPHENLVFPLFLPKTAEIVLHLGNQRQGAAALLVLGALLFHHDFGLHHRVLDMEAPLLKVRRRPFQPQHLGAAQAVEQGQQNNRLEWVVPYCLDKRRGLLRVLVASDVLLYSG